MTNFHPTLSQLALAAILGLPLLAQAQAPSVPASAGDSKHCLLQLPRERQQDSRTAPQRPARANFNSPINACALADANRDKEARLNDGEDPAALLAQLEEWDAMNPRAQAQDGQRLALSLAGRQAARDDAGLRGHGDALPYQAAPPPVPEPAAPALLLAGLALLAMLARRRRSHS